MAPGQVIDLTVDDSDSDDLSTLLSPQRAAVLATFGSRKQKVNVKDGVKPQAKSDQEVDNMSEEERRLDRVANAQLFHARRTSGDGLARPTRDIPRASVPPTVPPPPVLTGAGLQVIRTRNNDANTVFNNSLSSRGKRPAEDLDNLQMRPELPKRPRTSEAPAAAAPGKVEWIDLSEDSPPERITDDADLSTQEVPPAQTRPQSQLQRMNGPNMNGQPYTQEEDELLKKLKEEDGVTWDRMPSYFNGRTRGSLQTHYSTKLRSSDQRIRNRQVPERDREDTPNTVATSRPQRVRKSNVQEGMVSWTTLHYQGSRKPPSPTPEPYVSDPESEELAKDPLLNQDHPHSVSLSRILRQREMGTAIRRGSPAHTRTIIADELRNHVFDDYSLRRQYQGTSGDVITLSWSCSGTRFAAGSIAISDASSMQYNRPRNLLLGNPKSGELLELPEHHVARPVIDGAGGNVNSLHAMRETQDSRLFLTVTATGFSADGSRLYTSGTDGMIRHYEVDRDLDRVKCRYAVQHPASVDLLSVHTTVDRVIATGCHTASKSINVYRCKKQRYDPGSEIAFSPKREDLDTSVPIFPTCLKWAPSSRGHLLLGGFAGDHEKELAGETCLWEAETCQPISVRGATRNVFDVAWNPRPSAASDWFAVACNSSGIPVSKRVRSVIRCFGVTKYGLSTVRNWECPALDINDVVYSPYDDYLIAAGATDGRVYVWDQRFVRRSQSPLHVLEHGNSENVLTHGIDRELTDTGVRFLSWGASRDRLYTGSSDGLVKIWNPYLSPNNTHKSDVVAPTSKRSAVMSGSFSPDYRSLLIGTEDGAINLFDIGGKAVHKTETFKLRPASQPSQAQDPLDAARSMLDNGQIEIRPMGAMPVQQAVQGPSYNGPFLAPNALEMAEAKRSHKQASEVLKEKEASMKQTRDPLDSDDDSEDEDVVKAKARVQHTKTRIADLESRFKRFDLLEPKAKAFQRSLQHAERERAMIEAKLPCIPQPCKLDCCVLRTCDDDEIEDDDRSSLRIPQALRSIPMNAALLAEEEEHGTCVSKQSKMWKGDKTLPCPSTMLQRLGLRSTCSRCSGPTRIQTDPQKQPICELCSMTCFRCSAYMEVSPGFTKVSCYACQLTWEAGALGYELVDQTTRVRRNLSASQSDEDDVGEEEREHCASRWEDRKEEAFW